MTQQLKYLQGCIRDARTDPQAVALLRQIIHGAADSAPVEALIEVGECLVAMRERDLRDEAERN